MKNKYQAFNLDLEYLNSEAYGEAHGEGVEESERKKKGEKGRKERKRKLTGWRGLFPGTCVRLESI